MRIPGISLTSACDIFVEIGPDLDGFPSPDNLAAWAGLCPGNNESGGKRRSGKTLSGNKYLKIALVACDHGASRTKGCQFEGYHGSLNLRRSYKKATVATAHKRLRVIYSCLKTQTPYRDPNINYDQLIVERNALRWLKMLAEFGFIADTAQAKPAGVQ
ncbi:MAG: transposase [Aestuariivita sp.]|nr:transposase [Aestuariivita sp.]MCY4345705.1 transposase [Aestuariivita sp.]